MGDRTSSRRGSHGMWITTWAWQRPLTADAPGLQGVSELKHLLVESEAAADADGLHMQNPYDCQLNISSKNSPSATRVTPPLIRIRKSSRTSMAICPPGICTVILASQSPRR